MPGESEIDHGSTSGRKNEPKPDSSGTIWYLGTLFAVIILAYASVSFFPTSLEENQCLSEGNSSAVQAFLDQVSNWQILGTSSSQSPVVKQEQPKLTLYYFNTKSRGEAIRLFCAYAGLELNDITLAWGDFKELKNGSGKLPFRKVPLLEINDGEHYLVQTFAILRYLAIVSKKHPTDDPIAGAKIDAVLDQAADLVMFIKAVTYSGEFGLTPLENDDLWDEAFASLQGRVLPRELKKAEELIQNSKTGWMANTPEPSIADFFWYVAVNYYVKNNKWLDMPSRELQDYPGLQAFLEKLANLESIREFYEKRAASGKKEPASGQSSLY